MERKRFNVPFRFKALDDQQGTFTGDASVFGVIDFAGERVMPGAFKADLARRGSRRPLQWQHETNEPIGVVELVETDRSLRVVHGQLAMGVQRAREAYELLKVPGALGGMSIGYFVKRRQLGADRVVELLEIEILEVSIVTHPANPEARVDSVKARDASDLKQSLEILHCSIRSARIAADVRSKHRLPSASDVTRAADRVSTTLSTLAAQLAA